VTELEILDSCGNPTVRVHVALDDGTIATSSVPSGASTGENEAVEIRDGDKGRYGGKGVWKAVANIMGKIGPALISLNPTPQGEIDGLMISLDGTANKSVPSANAMLGVSMAIALFRKVGWALSPCIAPARRRTHLLPTSPWRWAAGRFKTGSMSRSERIAKYNRRVTCSPIYALCYPTAVRTHA
jgi:enolase